MAFYLDLCLSRVPGGKRMPYYRLYHVERDHFAGVYDFEAEDDVQAVRRAETLDGTATAELWCGKRKIKTFKPQAAAARGS